MKLKGMSCHGKWKKHKQKLIVNDYYMVEVDNRVYLFSYNWTVAEK